MEPLKPLIIYLQIMCALMSLVCGGPCLPAIPCRSPPMSVPYNGDWTVQQHPYSTIKPLDLLYDKLYRPPTSSMGVESRCASGATTPRTTGLHIFPLHLRLPLCSQSQQTYPRMSPIFRKNRPWHIWIPLSPCYPPVLVITNCPRQTTLPTQSFGH